jgi:dGTPase
MFNAMVGDLIATTARNVRDAGVASVDDVTRFPKRLAGFSPEMESKRAACKRFLYENLYYCPELKKDKQEGERVIAEMFDYWLKDPSTLPAQYRTEIEEGTAPARVVCDYIAGMTDNFIRQQWREAGLGR